MATLQDEIQDVLEKNFNGAFIRENKKGETKPPLYIYDLQPSALAMAIVEEILKKRFADVLPTA